MQYRVPPQFHLLLKHFVHSYALTIARAGAPHVQPEVHLLVLSKVHLSVHLYIDLNSSCIIRRTLNGTIKHIYRCSFCTLFGITG